MRPLPGHSLLRDAANVFRGTYFLAGSFTFSILSISTFWPLPSDFLDPADIDGLHDVAGFGVDQYLGRAGFPISCPLRRRSGSRRRPCRRFSSEPRRSDACRPNRRSRNIGGAVEIRRGRPSRTPRSSPICAPSRSEKRCGCRARVAHALSALSSIVISPWPRILLAGMPRSCMALVIAAGCVPPGMKMKMASGLRSFARCTKAEKSGLATGMRTEPTISPPASLNPLVNQVSASIPGP